MIMSYMPLARKDMFTLGYITKASQHLKLFGEYRFGGTSSETTVGAQVTFKTGNILKTTINTDYKAQS